VKAGKELPINGMCQSAGVSRAGYYRFQLEPGIGDADMGWRDEIQKIAVEWPSYGSRRIREELNRRGKEVNRKKVQRIMREDNLLCLRKRKFVVTTDSRHSLKVYPNLAAKMVLTGVNQYFLSAARQYLPNRKSWRGPRCDRMGTGSNCAATAARTCPRGGGTCRHSLRHFGH